MSDSAAETKTLMAAMLEGKAPDWKGRQVSGRDLGAALQSAIETGSGAPVISIVNARIRGDLPLQCVGNESQRRRLQITGCRISGAINAQQSHWRGVIVARTSLASVNFLQATVEHDLILELLECRAWLNLQGVKVGGDVSLSGTTCAEGDRSEAIDLSGAVIGGDFGARDLRCRGEFHADRVRLGGDFDLSGATLDDSGSSPAIALNLATARIDGRVQLTPGEKRFEAKGIVVLNGATIGALLARSARLDGCGATAIAGDQLEVRHTLDLTGDPGGLPIEAQGSLLFNAATINRQFQFSHASVAAPASALSLYGTVIGGDCVIGFRGGTTRIDGGLRADLARIGGSFRSEGVQLRSTDCALSLTQAVLGQDIAIHGLQSSGSLRFGRSQFTSFNLEDARIARLGDVSRSSNVPDNYAHAEDALLDLSFATIRDDVRFEAVTVEGGDVRMNGTKVGSTVQLIMTSIRAKQKHSLLAQGLVVEGGLHISGSRDVPARFEGDVYLLGARLGDLAMGHVQIGRPDRTSDCILTAITATMINISDSTVHGSVNAISTRVERDFEVNSSRLLNPGGNAFDGRRVRVGGKLHFATGRRADPLSCEIHGTATANSATVGVLAWHRVRLKPDSQLDLTSIVVERQVDAGPLVGEEPSQINLRGTTAPLLNDALDHDEDSWGAGKVRLGLDDFTYARLGAPSGRGTDDPAVTRLWRKRWLARRFDPQSPRPGRHLAQVLRNQGMTEASRLALMDAFSAEGRARRTYAENFACWVAGLAFGHLLSGRRAAITLIALWLAGAWGLAELRDRHLLVSPTETRADAPCASAFDPLLASADLMIPIVDLGHEKTCVVGKAPGNRAEAGIRVGQWRVFGDVEKYRALLVAFQLFGWIVLSLAIVTWSGLFRRAGRD